MELRWRCRAKKDAKARHDSEPMEKRENVELSITASLVDVEY
jgi:hypothetical protein